MRSAKYVGLLMAISLAGWAWVTGRAGEQTVTAEGTIATARKDERVQRLSADQKDVRARAEFSERYGVWLVHFFAGESQNAGLTVSQQRPAPAAL